MSELEFNLKFAGFTSSLHSFAMNLTKDKEEALDLFQDTAYKAIVNKEKFRVGTNFKAWLFTIMKNTFINNYRKKARKNTLIDSTENLYFINSSDTIVKNNADSDILLEELNELIDSLDLNLKHTFRLHFNGFKYHEIADMEKIPLGTVKSRIFLARKEIKRKLEMQYTDSRTGEKLRKRA
jgi:RNA polymerase sigma-70 factor (ECF subfamily)